MLAAMQLSIPPPEIGEAGLRALKTVALADGKLHELEQRWLESVQRFGLGAGVDIDALEPITGEQLAAIIPPGEYRERALRGALLIALIDTEASKEEQLVIDDFATALEVDRAPLRDFERIIAGRLGLLRFDIMRRAFIGKRIKQHVQAKGLRGLAQIIKSAAGFESSVVAERYRALEGYPKDSLGYGYWEFIRGNEFALPGEKDGAPEPIVFHDCVHVLGGYGISAAEVVLVVSFQSGFQNYDPFFSLLFAVSQFHLGIQISPVAEGAKFNATPEGLMSAFMRGTQCNRDLSDDWDPWDDFAVPVEELRQRYNIVPREGH